MHTSVYDNVSRDWQQKQKRIDGLPNMMLKGLRKTGSTTLKTNVLYSWLRTLYLGHVGEIADRHYDAKDGRSYPPLDEAITWLGDQFRMR